MQHTGEKGRMPELDGKNGRGEGQNQLSSSALKALSGFLLILVVLVSADGEYYASNWGLVRRMWWL